MSLPHLRDVSSWQGPVNWRQEKRLVEAVYVKVSEGMSYTDPTAQRRIRNATYVRLPVGGYHFCRPGVGSPEAQADRLLALAPLRPGQLRPCLDCEDQTSGLNQMQLATWYMGAAIRVHKRTGYWPTIYGSPSYLGPLMSEYPHVFGYCPLWLADYGVKRPTVPPPWSHWAAWQWTDAYQDPAVGRVDDSFLADLSALKIPLSARAIRAAIL
jgi:GH25 family lysozyme M1 (1,4-beta-N-acetylmuramidase)